jgi:hypothetical protein
MNTSMLRSVPAVLIACGALFLAASGGAVAGGLITGAKIKDGTVTTKDIRNKSLRAADLAPATVQQLKGAKGSPGLARAWAHVNRDAGLTVTRQSGGITATSPAPGRICVTVPGLSVETSSYVVSLDFDNDSTATGTQSYVEARPSQCPAPAFGIRSYYRNTADGTLTLANNGFFILIG